MNNLAYGSRTDVGRIREHNEDSLLVVPPLFVVADGMGGHRAGEVASEIAVRTLAAAVPDEVDAMALGRAVMAANRAVIRSAQEGVGREGMGTTMTAAMLEGDHLAVAQVGDSRLYLLHDRQLQQVTRDHSLVATLVESGTITPEEARRHPNRSVITRALGTDPEMRPDLYELAVTEGDRILLCSDGLYSMIWDDDIADILEEVPDPQRCADRLVTAANNAGGGDNITVIVIDVLSTELVEDRPGFLGLGRGFGRRGEARTASERQGRHAAEGSPSEGAFRRNIIRILCAFILMALLAFGGFYAYARHSAYLIAQDGYVTVYKGLVDEEGGGSRMSWLVEKTDIPLASLPQSAQVRLEKGIQLKSLDEAMDIVEGYREDYGTRKAPDADDGAGAPEKRTDQAK